MRATSLSTMPKADPEDREDLIGIKLLGWGLTLSILRYAHELRLAEPYFEGHHGSIEGEGCGARGRTD